MCMTNTHFDQSKCTCVPDAADGGSP
jgi:hypothetical protein